VTTEETLEMFNKYAENLRPPKTFETLMEEVEQRNIDDFIECYSDKSERLKNMIELLVDCDYFTAPAAKSHHGNIPGGLYKHSKEVTEQLVNFTNKLGLRWQKEDSPLVVGLLHDLCKTQSYKIKPKETGYEIEYIGERLLDGHGSLSLIIALDLIEWLTKEEMMCIRYHMGAYTDQKEWPFVTRAVQQYPNVLYTQTANIIASQIKNI